MKEKPNSIWLRLIRNWLDTNQIKEGDAAGSWGEEIWDTAMCLLAFKSFEVSSRDPIVKNSIDWIGSLYRVNRRNNWHDEPWETSWALIAILTAGKIPNGLIIEEPVKWLLEFQEPNGKIISPHYTAYYLLIWEKLRKIDLSENDQIAFATAKDLSVTHLLDLLNESSEETLWSNEAWANGQILWALCAVKAFPVENEALMNKTINWFDNTQSKRGNWSDIEDTSSAIIGLHNLLETIISSEELFRNRNVKESLQKRLSAPDVYIKKPFIERHPETGGLSINLNNGFMKTLALIAALGAGLGTILSLIEFVKKLFID